MSPELEASIRQVLRTAEEVLDEDELKRLGEALATEGITLEVEGQKYADAENDHDAQDVIPAYRHRDKRLNIPTDQHALLVDTTGDGEANVALYRRDPALDPQLVWRGKEEANSEDLAVPVVPIYIQEKVDPRVVVENIRRTADDPSRESELKLFDDFDGIDDPIESIEYYQHAANWSNRLILGDSLVAMNSLAEKENLKRGVQTIYFDPPYGISFASNWQVSTRTRNVSDGRDHTRQPEQIRAFRDTWSDGIHTYLGYLRDRLQVARSLLTDTGSIFVQIGASNVHLVRALLDEIFGSDRFVSLISVKKTATPSEKLDDGIFYIIWYSKTEEFKYRQLWLERDQVDWMTSTRGGSWGIEVDGHRERLPRGAKSDPSLLPDGSRIYALSKLTSAGAPSKPQPFEWKGEVYYPGRNAHWKTSIEGLHRLDTANRLESRGGPPWFVRFHDDFPFTPLTNLWTDTAGKSSERIFVVQTEPDIVERCILMSTDPGDLVLDPTCGSGTTAFVAEHWGRRWVTIDTSRVALALARQRLMGAVYPYYLLVDSQSGSEAQAEELGQVSQTSETRYGNDIRRGFVYRRAPHVTLSSIAKNEEIVPEMTKDELDNAIRRASDLETLYDQPHVDSGTLRVSGPFTVESLSPHRTVAPGDLEYQSASEASALTDARETGFVEMVLDNLEKAGVQNGYKEERLSLDWIEPHAGQWIQGLGSFTDADNQERRIAIAIGPETGTVGRELIANIAKEAATDIRADLVLVCAYAFDAGASEEANTVEPAGKSFAVTESERKLGKIKVLNVRINADLMMDEELKSTGTGNLFMVFGEPDVSISQVDDETISVELVGLDIYDPNKGSIRSAEPDDLACWFIDTDYNGDAFFVRHAYFTGGGSWDPYKSLKRALKSEINEEAWAKLYRTESMPFPKPETGKIAVKAINHFGDEAMRVFEIS